MKLAKQNIIYSRKQIQDEKSTACGWFCIACIISDYKEGHRDTLTHYNRFINSFSRNTYKNDGILKSMLHFLWVVNLIILILN